ncbi:PH domain-containing protein [Streptomyces sp. NPDC006283]|uniref:PH domain-containing protein n=1 Tax=Streptomyces sp. NPDC006283 TaxID=3156741 RepID=UPI0033B60636
MFVGTWNWISFLLGLLTLFIGISVLTSGDFAGECVHRSPHSDRGGLGVVDGSICGVRVDDAGIRYRGIFKRVSLPWSEVQSISVDCVGGDGLLEAEMPVVKKADGKDLPILILAGYTSGQPRVNGRVRRQASVMQEALRRANRS